MLHALSLGRKTLLTQQLSASFLRPVGAVSMQTPLRFLSKKAERAKAAAAAAAAGEETMGAETVKTPSANSTSNALRDTLKQIEKDFGKDAIMRLGSKSIVPCEVISTGSIGLDAALGVGGLPRGRITEIYGPESSGKTSLTLHVIAEAQKLGGTCMFIDAEHALDIHYAQQVGVNTADLYISQPNSGEQALEIADKMIISGAVDVIVVDSVASLLPRAELEGEMGDHHIGKQARLMSQALRKLCHSLSIHKKTVLIFTNQIRMKVGVLFGSPETTPGGNALKFYSSVRLDSRKIAVQKKGDDIQGIQVRVTVVKNKVSPPLQKAIFDLEFGKGISKSGELVDLGVNYEILSKSGSWYSFRDRQLAQGRDKMKTLFEQDPVLAGEVSSALRQAILDPHNTKQVAAEEEEDVDVESVPEVVAEPVVE